MRWLFNLLLAIHYVSPSLKSAAIRYPQKNIRNLYKMSVIYKCHPSPNWLAIICIQNSVPNIFVQLLCFMLLPLGPVEPYCTIFFCLPLPFCVADTLFLFLLVCCPSCSYCSSCWCWCYCCCCSCCCVICLCSCSFCSLSCCSCSCCCCFVLCRFSNCSCYCFCF